MEDLRQAVRPLHAQLDATECSRGLLAEPLTLPHYRRLLWRWAQVWPTLEAALEGAEWVPVVARLMPRPRALELQADLRILGLPGGLAAAARSGPAVPQPRSPGALLGLCYALRELARAHQSIGRHLQQQLGLDALHGAGFFAASCGERLPWPAWLVQLDAALPGPQERTAAIDSACQSFRYLIGQLAPASPSPELPPTVALPWHASVGRGWHAAPAR